MYVGTPHLQKKHSQGSAHTVQTPAVYIAPPNIITNTALDIYTGTEPCTQNSRREVYVAFTPRPDSQFQVACNTMKVVEGLVFVS